MRNLRKLLLLAVMACAAMAFAAPSAFATFPVEVTDADGIHCGPVSVVDHSVSGGCEVHVVSDGNISLISHRAGMGEVIVNDCLNEYTLNIDENGEGWIHAISLTGGVGCGTNVQPCVEDDGHQEPWHIDVEHDGLGGEEGIAEFCVNELIAPGVRCEWEGDLEVDLTNDGGAYSAESENANEGKQFVVETTVAHPAAAQANCVALAPTLEVEGHWDFENPQGIAINHL